MTDEPTLGEALVREVSRAAGEPVEAAAGGLVASADVVGSGPYGAEIRGVRVTGGARAVRDVVDALASGLEFLPEPVEPFEVGDTRGILRTRRSAVLDREYYEVSVEDGVVDFARYRGALGGGRERLSDNFGHRSIERLVDAVAGAVTEPPDEEW